LLLGDHRLFPVLSSDRFLNPKMALSWRHFFILRFHSEVPKTSLHPVSPGDPRDNRNMRERTNTYGSVIGRRTKPCLLQCSLTILCIEGAVQQTATSGDLGTFFIKNGTGSGYHDTFDTTRNNHHLFGFSIVLDWLVDFTNLLF
jgi:hypothetical protein